MSVITELRERRKTLGMPLDVIPKRAGISASSANRVLCKPTRYARNVKVNPSLETLESLCKAMGLRLTVTVDVPGDELRRQRAIEKCGGVEPAPEVLKKLADSEFVWVK